MARGLRRTAGSSRPRRVLVLLGVLGAFAGLMFGVVSAFAAAGPTVSSFTRVGSSPTNAGSVSWSVVFSSSVTGVSASNFSLQPAGGVSGAGPVLVSGSGSSYTVSAATGSGNGTLGLNLSAGSIKDSSNHGLQGAPYTGPVYAIDKTPPTASISAVGSSPTNASSVSWSVVFSKPVTGVTAAGFQLVVAGGLGGSPTVTGVSGSGTTYTVAASTGSGNGTLGVKIPSAGSIKDSAGNSLAGTSVSGPAYTLDRTAPTVSSFTLVGVSPTNASSVSWSVVFSKAVTGVTAAGFQLVVGGGLVSSSLTAVSGSGTTYTVTASSGSGSGTLGLKIPSAGSIKDSAGNALAGTPVSGPAYTIDRTPLTVSITRIDPSPTNALGVRWAVSFNKAVTGVGASNFSLVTSGITGPTAVTGVSGSGSSYTVTASTGTGTPSGAGSEQLQLSSGGSIKDQAGNSPSVPVNGDSYTIDHLAPTVVSINRADASPRNTGPLHWTVTFSEPVSNLGSGNFGLATSGLAGTAPSITAVSPGSGPSATYTVTVSTAGSTGSNSGQVGLNLTSKGSTHDPAGNTLGGSTPVVGQTYTYDTTPPPTPVISSGPASMTNQTTATLVFSESEGTAGLFCRLDGGSYLACSSPKPYNGLSDGSHSFQVVARDQAGNQSAAASWNWTVDTAPPPAPTINSGPFQPPLANSSTSATFTFSEPGSGGDSDNDGDNDGGDGGGGPPAESVSYLCSLDGASYTACASPKSYTGLSQGSHTFRVEALDAAGNVSSPTSWTFIVDTIPPTVTFTQTPPKPDTNTGPTFKWTGNDGANGSGVAAYFCKLDSGSWQFCSSPDTLSGLSLGSHTFQVEAVDWAGNLSTAASYTWLIQTVSAGQPYTISGNTTAPLYPGAAPQPVNVTFNSPNVGNGGSGVNGTRVSSLVVSIASVTGGSNTPNPCTAADFKLTQFSGAYSFYVPQGTSTLSTLGFAPTTWPTVQMINRAANQDGCKGATVNLSYTGTP
jgi:hypothetical protein